jgi:hypothetical protein
MQHVRNADTEIQSRGINHRMGSFRYKDLGQGEPGTTGNYYLRLVWSETDFFSPRHMHNFDQVRVQVQGQFDFATDGTMKLGTIGYFPEGTPYGPQTSKEETIQLVLQIGGASGSGYISEAQRVAAVAELAAVGRFSDGRYFAPGDRTTTGMDSFQAAWEQAQGRKLVYPPMRFQKPVLMHPDAMPWMPVPGAPGVECRQAFSFGSRSVAVVLYKIAAGATLALDGPLSCFIESGAGQAMGQGGTERFAAWDALHAAPGESLTLTPCEATQTIVFVHPVF